MSGEDRLHDIGMICADTVRTRIYLQALAQHNLAPNRVLVMKTATDRILPGQRPEVADSGHLRPPRPRQQVLGLWLDPDASLADILTDAGMLWETIDAMDVNGDIVISRLSQCAEAVFIYSGIGGVILRRPVLSVGKRFLHVHGGYLPHYKGSTTNYYSWLHGDGCGASSIFMTPELDGGPILLRKTFPPPPPGCDFDYLYDSAVRARVLVDTITAYATWGCWRPTDQETGSGEVYFIIHPVLRHLALLRQQGAAGP